MFRVIGVIAFLGLGVAQAQEGIASVYGNENGQWRRADGKRYVPSQIGCACRSGRLGRILTVTNLQNGLSLRVPCNDRGPFVRGRIIDLSKGAARALGVHGLTRVRIGE